MGDKLRGFVRDAGRRLRMQNMVFARSVAEFLDDGPRYLGSELADLVVDYYVEGYDEDDRQHHPESQESIGSFGTID